MEFRDKYRIRIYDMSDKVIKFERKHKNGQFIGKKSLLITRQQCDAILAGEYRFLLHRQEDFAAELYAALRTEGWRPKVLVDYDREPFVFPLEDVRVTIDRNIRTGLRCTDLPTRRPANISTAASSTFNHSQEKEKTMDNVFQYILQLQNYQPMLTILTVLAAFLVGLYVFFIYRITFAGVIYSRTFNLSLVMLCMVTATVIMFMANNVKLSLGMVGALSIVRFRTAIKDPIDTVFMFWAIAEGIALGAGYFIAGVIAAVFIGLCMIVISVIKGRSTMPYLLILHYDESASKQIKQMVAQLPQGRIKSKTVQREGIEMTVELRVRQSETGFVDKFMRVEGVYDATLIAHQGDMIS